MAIYHILDFHGIKVSYLQTIQEDKLFGGLASEYNQEKELSDEVFYCLAQGYLRSFADENGFHKAFDYANVTDKEVADYFLKKGKSKILLFREDVGKETEKYCFEVS